MNIAEILTVLFVISVSFSMGLWISKQVRSTGKPRAKFQRQEPGSARALWSATVRANRTSAVREGAAPAKRHPIRFKQSTRLRKYGNR